jgi:hypothetical protein
MQIHRSMPGLYGFFFIIHLTLFQICVAGGQATLSATASTTEPSAGDYFDISIALLPESDLYYAELVVSFNSNILEFVSVANGPLTEGGIHLSGELSNGRAGVSVSRTTALPVNAAGVIMVLTFRVRERAVSGNTEVLFSDLIIRDSRADLLHSGIPGPLTLSITTGIVDLRMLVTAHNTIAEGDLFTVEAIFLVAGSSGNQGMVCQAGINRDDSDPASWNEESWIDMTFTGSDAEDYLHYFAEVAFMRAPGEWFLAIRSSLCGEVFVYGGPEGILSHPHSPLARLSITGRPFFRYPLASWDFNMESSLPSKAIAVNNGSVFQISGSTITGYLSGYAGMALNSNRWSDTGPCYWWVEFSTRGFVSLEVSSRQYGSATGPRDFHLEYSIDGFQWQRIEGAGIVVGSNWNSGRLDCFPLPAAMENRDRVFLRWIISSDISINGAITGSTGTNRIDDVIITGINPEPRLVTVYPGDSSNDGTVNADDVLPLGIYWLSRGPSAAWENVKFTPRSIEEWIPAGATFADTNGDGIVDHRDLLAVGLHFGKSVAVPDKEGAMPLASLVIDPLEGERTRKIMIESNAVRGLRGVAFGIGISGIPGDMWKPGEIVPLFIAGPPREDILSFYYSGDSMLEAAFVQKGSGDGMLAHELAGFELTIDEQWTEKFTIYLNRLTLSVDGSTALMPGEGRLVLTGITSVPSMVTGSQDVHLKNYPNPFRDFSEVSFVLDAPARVRLEISCMQGRVLATLIDGFRDRGSHSVPLDGRFLSSGIYLCRMITTEGYNGVIKIIRVP